MTINIRNNGVASFIAGRRWMRRLGIFNCPKKFVSLHRAVVRKFICQPVIGRAPSYHVLNWGLETYKSETIGFLRGVLSKTAQPVFLDVGANIGIFSFSLATAIKDLEIHAFEPETSSFDCLRSTFSQIGFENVTVHQVAVTDAKGDVTLFRDEENHGGHSVHIENIEAENNRVGASTVVPGSSVDLFIQDNQLTKVDVIKIDIQGHETVALKGAQSTIREMRPIVLMECLSQDLFVQDAPLTSVFKTNGYRAFYPGAGKTFEIDLACFENVFDKAKAYHDIVFVPEEKKELVL